MVFLAFASKEWKAWTRIQNRLIHDCAMLFKTRGNLCIPLESSSPFGFVSRIGGE